ncbi:MAG: S8 family serine peptidase [Candidatus Eremiobacteraeota bacterium]|nr:S8 family serine peptidase [Candidatus Eremiobacteraeota bacterium]MCW5869336.1 S8 family serine peptidase [Candidatus Eremiobacteraeota bacterium]
MKILSTGYAEPRERAPRLALLDDFDGDPNGFPHGQAVESVLLGHSDLQSDQIQRMQNEPPQADLTKLIKENKLDFVTAFRAMTARNLAGFYAATARNLQTIVQEQPSVQVISQSQGETSARQLEMIFDGVVNNQAFRQGVAQTLGQPEASAAQICQALLDEADAVAGKDPLVLKARKEYQLAAREAYNHGLTYVVAAGNHGDFARQLEQMGVEASPSAFRNILVCDYVTVVGANDAQGRESSLNSPHAGVEVRALGEDIAWHSPEGESGVNSGTSFATPIVAGQVLRELDQNPRLTPFQLENKLAGLDSYQVNQGERLATSNGRELVGDGQLEAYIAEQIGPGFVTDLAGADAQQLAQAHQDSTFFGLPGAKDHEFQLVRMAPNLDGKRQLEIDTWFKEGHHVLQAVAENGVWTQFHEELHLDKAREQTLKLN